MSIEINLDENVMNSVLEDLGSILVNLAAKTFGTYQNKRDGNKINNGINIKNQKPWLDQDCRFLRQNFRQFKRNYKSNKSDEIFSNINKTDSIKKFLMISIERVIKGTKVIAVIKRM